LFGSGARQTAHGKCQHRWILYEGDERKNISSQKTRA
jgi:hypothetical protein